jgi:hypothetical protein
MTKKKENPQKAGRHKLFETPEELQQKIEEYIKKCPDVNIFITKTGKKIKIAALTISGLAYHLGFDSRQSFYDYEEIPEFSYTIKRARLFIEKEYEKGLKSGNPGIIFALKNFGWKDKVEQELTGESLIKKVYITAEQQQAALEHIKDVIGDTNAD